MKKSNIVPILILVLLAVVGFWLRINDVFETTIYNGDEGRNYLFASRIWQGDLTLIGPAISTVRFFLPPTWYYLVSIPLMLGGWSINGPLLFMVLLGTAAIPLYFFIGKMASGKSVGGLFAATFFALSPYSINAARTTGNHVMIPALSGLYFYFLIRFFKNKKENDLVIASAVLGFAFSFHFSLLVLVVGQVAIICFINKNLEPFNILKKIVPHLLLLGLWWLPIVLFDLRNSFINFKGFWWYLSRGDVNELRNVVGQGDWSVVNNLRVGLYFFRNFIGIKMFEVWVFHLIAVIGGILLFIRRQGVYFSTRKIAIALFGLIMLFGGSFLFYKGYVAEHFFYPILPAYYVILSLFLIQISGRIWWLILVALLILPYRLLSQDAYAASFRRPKLVEWVSGQISEDLLKIDNQQKYSIFLKKSQEFWSVAYEYKYLVETTTKRRAVDIHSYSDADILYVVSEIKTDDPLKIGNWEVTSFNPKKVDWGKEIGQYKLFRLSK